jgi:diguanylate cyclase (GGDEF)-like protein
MTADTRVFKNIYDRYLLYILSEEPGAMPEQAMLVTTLVNVSLLAALLVPVFLLEYAVVGMWRLVLPLSIAGMVMVGVPMIYRLTRSLFLARESFIFALFSFKAWECAVFNDVVSPGSIWFMTLPLIGIMLGSVCSAVIWLLVSSMALVAMHLTLAGGVVFALPAAQHPHFLYIFSLIGASIAIAAFLLMVENARRVAFQRLRAANKTISELAIRDALTGVFNRRHIVNEVSRAEAGARRFSICLLDLDHFKSINDTYGHATGDDTLKAVATAIQAEVRKDDCFGRYGGEEFLLLLIDTDLDGSRQFLERIRLRIEALVLNGIATIPGVTVSVGIAQYRQGETYAQTINRADQALYGAKAAGRNRIMLENAV